MASFTNTALVSGETLACQLEASATVPAGQEPRLTVGKALCPDEIPCNGEITYTFLIQNSGSAPADQGDQGSLADTFDPVLSDLTVTYNGAVQSQGGFFTYDPASGQFATVPGEIAVPAAVFTQNDDGTWTTDPGSAVVTVTGQLGGGGEIVER